MQEEARVALEVAADASVSPLLLSPCLRGSQLSLLLSTTCAMKMVHEWICDCRRTDDRHLPEHRAEFEA